MNAFELDRAGGAEVLKELAAAMIGDLALEVAGHADEAAGEGSAAKVADYAQVREYVTDRAVATVSVPVERQAKYGALTRAAAAAGLEVTPK